MPRLASLAALAALAVLVSCDARSEGPEPRLLLMTWSDYSPAEVFADFEKEAGCRVEVASYVETSNDILAKLASKDSGLDVVVPSDAILATCVANGLLERLDLSKVPNRSHVDPAFFSAQADPKGEWAVPFTWGTVGLAWRTDKVKVPVDSWNVLATDAGGGNAFLLADARDVVATALLARGLDLDSTAPADLAAAKETLLAWKSRVKAFTAEGRDMLVSGEAWLLQAYNGDAAQAKRERTEIGYAVPKEGGILWIDHLAIPRGAPHRDLAHRFLDFLLRPDVAARTSAAIRYAVCNRDALPLVPKEVLEDPTVYATEEVRRRCRQEKDLGKDLVKVVDLYNEVRAGG
jgi:spermidine/putrescine transport system substrate-binding protein